MQLPNYKLNIPGYTILYHNTSDNNVDSILVNGLKADAGKDQNRGKDGDFVWATNIPNLRGYGGNTIAFKVPSDGIENYKVNDTEYTLPFDIPASDILFVDRFIFPNTRLSDIPKLLDKFGKDKVIDTFTKNQNKLINISLDSLLNIINGNLNEDASIDEKKQQLARAKKYVEENPDDPDNDEVYGLIDKLEKELNNETSLKELDDPYQPGEREAMNGLFNFENSTVRDALEKEFPGSCQGFWMGGSPMDWKSKVPVIADIRNKAKIINLLAKEFGVSKDKVEFAGLEKTKVKKTDPDRHYSDNYIPYKTINKMVFNVDWKETTNEDLKRYQDYIRSSMKNQGIEWESEILEGINQPTQNRIGNFALDVLVDRRYGNAKFTDIADVEVGPDYIDIAFDFMFRETETINGLSGKPSKVIHPTPTEIEVTEKRIDKFMTEDFPTLFFRYYKVTPFFRIIADEHRWIDKDSLACFYTIEQFNERK